MRAPATEVGKLKIYLERLDSIFINAIHPVCFLCSRLFTTADKCAISINAGNTIRLHGECFDTLLQGVAIFAQAESGMKVFTNEIQ